MPSSEEIKNLFFPVELGDFFDAILFKGSIPGFSVKTQYPDNLPYTSPTTPTGQKDVVSLVKIAFEIHKTTNGLIPIFIGIYPFSLYLYNRFDYNFNDPNCPTKDSISRLIVFFKHAAMIFGREFKESAEISLLYKKNQYIKLQTNSYNLFGYMLPKGLMVCTVLISCISAFAGYKGHSIRFFSQVFAHSYFSVTFLLLFIFICEFFLAWIPFWVVNRLLHTRRIISDWRFKI